MSDKPAVKAKAEAAKAEANGTKTVPMEWRGETIDIPSSPERAHPKVVRAMERELATEMAEGILGSKRFDAWMDDPDAEMAELTELMESVAKAWGFESTGNS